MEQHASGSNTVHAHRWSVEEVVLQWKNLRRNDSSPRCSLDSPCTCSHGINYRNFVPVPLYIGMCMLDNKASWYS